MLMVQRVSRHFLSKNQVSRGGMERFLSATTQTLEDDYMDVLIIGGGAVGCTLARSLNETLPHLKVGLLEARDAPPPLAPKPTPETVPHPRSYALSPNSLKIIGEKVTSQIPCGYYDAMQVWQANSPACLTFTTRDLDADPLKAPFLGACVEDGPLVSALWEDISSKSNIICRTNTTLTEISCGDSHHLATVKTSEGEEIKAGVVIGADGGNSWVRKSMGVSRSGTEYEQQALTFTVKLHENMRKRAFQRFLGDGGPMALLPTYSPHHAVVVWSTSPASVKEWKEASNDDLIHHLNQCLEEGPQRIPPLLERANAPASDVVANLLYGAEKVLDTLHYGLAMASHHPVPKYTSPPRISEIVSPKLSFPLSCFQAQKYVTGRVALIGDAAHTVHPMAGQGLNLGLADVQVLVDCMAKASRAGMDVSVFLDEYNMDRRRNISISLGGIHALQRLFGSQNVPLQHAKTLGMNIIQNLGPLRRQLALAAAHGVQF